MRKDIIKQMSGVLFMLIAIMLVTGKAKAQEVKRSTQTDSVAIKKLSADTGIPKAKAAQVLQAMRYGSGDFARIATDSKTNRQEQRFQIMRIQSQRKRKLDSLLTPGELMALSRQQASKLQQQRSADSLVLLQQRQRMEQGGGQMVKQE